MPREKELALRGHDGSIEPVNKGNILQLLDLITKQGVIANVVWQHVAQNKPIASTGWMPFRIKRTLATIIKLMAFRGIV